MRYILGIDIGTTAIKGAVIGEDGKIYGTKTSEYPLTTLPTGEVINITSLCVKLSHGWIQERRKKPSI